MTWPRKAHPAGAGYVARTRITQKDGTVLAAIGERCDRVPETHLARFAARGYIQEVPVPVAPAAPEGDE